MSFQFPERSNPPSISPSGNTFPALLVAREVAPAVVDIEPELRERAARRVTRKVLDIFWRDIEAVCSAPFLQLTGQDGVGGYNEAAKRNRERVSADRVTR